MAFSCAHRDVVTGISAGRPAEYGHSVSGMIDQKSVGNVYSVALVRVMDPSLRSFCHSYRRSVRTVAFARY